MGAVECEAHWLGVHQCMSSVLGMEKETPMFTPFPEMSLKILCSRGRSPWWGSEATVMARSST